MDRTRLVIAITSVFAGTAVVLAVAGVVSNPVFVALAIPFAVAVYLLWGDVTGRTARRFRSRRAYRGRAPRGGRTRRTTADRDVGETSRADARRVLGVGPDADDATLRRAYRDRVKAVHPDTEGGDEEAFKRVTDAYERLRD